MGCILALYEPLHIDTLKMIHISCHPRHYRSGIVQDEDDVTIVLSSLGSLMSGVGSTSIPVRPLHASFRDFLSSPSRSDKFYISPADNHGSLARVLLHVLDKGLKFNICKIETSYWPNSKIPDLDERIRKHIPPELLYACRFIFHHLADHVQCCQTDDGILHDFHGLLMDKVLFWLEVLSLSGRVPETIQSMGAVSRAIVVSTSAPLRTKTQMLKYLWNC